MIAVKSDDPLTTRVLSLLIATVEIILECPVKVNIFYPVRLHMIAVLSHEPVTIRELSLLIATL
jgi:hypothetical protein